MTYHLENQHLKIAVALKGAELKSVVKKATQQEIVWQGNPDFWAKSSPVLFPIVGTLKNGMYGYEAKEYQLPRHGFARDYNFKLDEVSNAHLVLSLEASPDTLQLYPFVFKLQIIYTLMNNSLQVEYKVENLSDVETMYFSLGAHPAFNVGIKADDFSSYSLLFNKDSVLEATRLNNGLLTMDKNTITLTNQKLQLNYELFVNDALVILDMKSGKITLVDKNDKNILNFEFENFPYFGLWTVEDSGFICLEPWSGISDFETHNQDIKTKSGINTLNPKENWSASWTISIP